MPPHIYDMTLRLMYKTMYGDDWEHRLRTMIETTRPCRRYNKAWLHLRKARRRLGFMGGYNTRDIPSLDDDEAVALMDRLIALSTDRHVVRCCRIIKQEVSRGR